MDGLLLPSEAQMRRIEPYRPLWHGGARVDDRHVVDASKFSTSALHRIGGIDTVHTIVTDTHPPQEARSRITGIGVELICVDPPLEGNDR